MLGCSLGNLFLHVLGRHSSSFVDMRKDDCVMMHISLYQIGR
jgi:hypothetical protein